MLFIFFAESSKLCLKDLSDDVTHELIQKLEADEATLEKFYQFFGLILGDGSPLKGTFPFEGIKNFFPDTTVSVLKECFEALRMYDLAETMDKVKPRSLHPALSPEQIEKLWRAGDRPTKYHSDVAVLVVKHSVKGDIVEREVAEKIETFFKDLNSRNEVVIISLVSSPETREVLMEIKKRNHGMRYYHLREGSLRGDYERILQRKARLEKKLEEVMEKGRKQRWSNLDLQLLPLEDQEFGCRIQLENIVKEKKEAERDFEKLKELEKESAKPISTTLDKWIHNQG